MYEPESFPEELEDLIDEYFSGLLDEAGLQQLEEWLRRDVGARSLFVRHARLHTDLHLEIRARKASGRALDQIDQLTAGNQEVKSRQRPPRVGWRPALVAAAGCVLVALALGGWLRERPTEREPSREPAIAWLVNAQNCAWSEDGPEGDLRPGRVLHLERGLAEVSFACGARVILQGPARLELLSGKAARLHHGKLAARVPKAAAGFELLSPQGKVIDLGTEFGVTVSDQGATEVYVFEGKVEALPKEEGNQAAPLSVVQNQAARMAGGQISRLDPAAARQQFVRAILPLPVPRSLRLSFDRAGDDGIRDAAGLGTGLRCRLPGTGGRLPERDPHLRVNTDKGCLELTTTRSDIRNQIRLGQGEYLGFRLSELGFTGKEDFAITATIQDIPILEDYGQFGLYAGTKSDRNIRGGFIRWGRQEPDQNTQFLVNNLDGIDKDLFRVGLLSPGTDLRLTLRRIAGEFSMTVENLTEGGASALSIRHPEFLDGEPDLFVGLFGANPYNDVPKVLRIKEFGITVWTIPAAKE